jgi:hypothetical protein
MFKEKKPPFCEVSLQLARHLEKGAKSSHYYNAETFAEHLVLQEKERSKKIFDILYNYKHRYRIRPCFDKKTDAYSLESPIVEKRGTDEMRYIVEVSVKHTYETYLNSPDWKFLGSFKTLEEAENAKRDFIDFFGNEMEHGNVRIHTDTE